jgi:hypothetical protein
MSGSTEVPDIIGGISNAIGLNKSWPTDEQVDFEKRKSEQEAEKTKPANSEEEHQPIQTPEKAEDSGFAAPISIKMEWEKDQKGDTGVDHDIDVHGVPRRLTPPISHEVKRYEWPMPASLKDNRVKMKTGSGPSQGDRPESWTDETPQLSKGEGEITSSFTESPIATQSQQESSSSTTPQRLSVPLSGENFTKRPRPLSCPPQRNIDPPVPRREFTMPVRPTRSGSSETPNSETKSAKSRWVSATNALRFPLRRRKTEIKASTGPTGLIATLAAGAPAATILASHMIADERSHHRVPVIVDLLKVPFHAFSYGEF